MHTQILLEQHEQIKMENERIDDGEEMGRYSAWPHTSHEERNKLNLTVFPRHSFCQCDRSVILQASVCPSLSIV